MDLFVPYGGVTQSVIKGSASSGDTSANFLRVGDNKYFGTAITSVQASSNLEDERIEVAEIEVTVTGTMPSPYTTKKVLATLECSSTGNPTLEMQVYNYTNSSWTNMITSTQGIGTSDATYQCVKTSTTANGNYQTTSGNHRRMKFKIKLAKTGSTQFVAKFDRFEAGTR